MVAFSCDVVGLAGGCRRSHFPLEKKEKKKKKRKKRKKKKRKKRKEKKEKKKKKMLLLVECIWFAPIKMEPTLCLKPKKSCLKKVA